MGTDIEVREEITSYRKRVETDPATRTRVRKPQGRNETLALAKRKFEVEYTGVHYVTLTKNWNTTQWIRPRYNVVAQIVGTTRTGEGVQLKYIKSVGNLRKNDA